MNITRSAAERLRLDLARLDRRSAPQLPGRGSSPASTIRVRQVAHGFAPATPVRFDGSTWLAALADAPAHAVVAGLAYPINADHFQVVMSGAVKLAGMTPGATYYLSASGDLVTPAPSSGPIVAVLLAISATKGVLLDRAVMVSTAPQYAIIRWDYLDVPGYADMSECMIVYPALSGSDPDWASGVTPVMGWIDGKLDGDAWQDGTQYPIYDVRDTGYAITRGGVTRNLFQVLGSTGKHRIGNPNRATHVEYMASSAEGGKVYWESGGSTWSPLLGGSWQQAYAVAPATGAAAASGGPLVPVVAAIIGMPSPTNGSYAKSSPLLAREKSLLRPNVKRSLFAMGLQNVRCLEDTIGRDMRVTGYYRSAGGYNVFDMLLTIKARLNASGTVSVTGYANIAYRGTGYPAAWSNTAITDAMSTAAFSASQTLTPGGGGLSFNLGSYVTVTMSANALSLNKQVQVNVDSIVGQGSWLGVSAGFFAEVENNVDP